MQIIQKPPQPKEAVLSNPRELRYANEEKTRVDMIIHHSEYGDIEFTADKHDEEEHGRAVYETVINDPELAILDYDLYHYQPHHPNNPANIIPVVEV